MLESCCESNVLVFLALLLAANASSPHCLTLDRDFAGSSSLRTLVFAVLKMVASCAVELALPKIKHSPYHLLVLLLILRSFACCKLVRWREF